MSAETMSIRFSAQLGPTPAPAQLRALGDEMFAISTLEHHADMLFPNDASYQACPELLDDYKIEHPFRPIGAPPQVPAADADQGAIDIYKIHKAAFDQQRTFRANIHKALMHAMPSEVMASIVGNEHAQLPLHAIYTAIRDATRSDHATVQKLIRDLSINNPGETITDIMRRIEGVRTALGRDVPPSLLYMSLRSAVLAGSSPQNHSSIMDFDAQHPQEVNRTYAALKEHLKRHVQDYGPGRKPASALAAATADDASAPALKTAITARAYLVDNKDIIDATDNQLRGALRAIIKAMKSRNLDIDNVVENAGRSRDRHGGRGERNAGGSGAAGRGGQSS